MKPVSVFLFACLLIASGVHVSYAQIVGDTIPVVQNGKTIYYEIIIAGSPNTVKVVHPPAASPHYAGDIVIPSTVTYSSVVYQVTSVDNEVFKDCATLTSVTFPATVTSIGNDVFSGSTALTTLIFLPETPPAITGSTFTGFSSTATIRVPAGKKTNYTGDSNWQSSVGAQIWQPEITLTPLTLPKFAVEGETKTFDVYTTVNVTVSRNQSWLTVSPVSVAATVPGGTTQTITVVVPRNTSTSERTATVTLTGAGAVTQTITVTQAAQPVAMESILVPSSGCDIAFPVAKGAAWAVSLFPDYAWCRVSPISGNGASAATVSISVAPNPTPYVRVISLRFTFGGTTHYDVLIEQSALLLEASPQTLTFEKEGGEKTVSLTSVADWTAVSNQPWLTVTPAYGSGGTSTVKIKALENKAVTETNQRTARVVFKNTRGVLDTLLVTQKEPEASLIYSPTAISVLPPTAYQLNIKITANVNWIVEVADADKGWISVSPASGSNDGSFLISLTENKLNASRGGKVTIKGGSGIMKVIALTQSSASAVPDSVTLNVSRLRLKPGETKQLTATVHPVVAYSKAEVVWATDNPNVATVVNGWVIGIAKGVTRIRVFTTQGAKMASCEVEVSDEQANESPDGGARVCIEGAKLIVNTPVAEQLSVYTVGGLLLWQSQKKAGQTALDAAALPEGLLIVEGSSGWSEKIMIR